MVIPCTWGLLESQDKEDGAADREAVGVWTLRQELDVEMVLKADPTPSTPGHINLQLQFSRQTPSK
jgi:hypothetical protein